MANTSTSVMTETEVMSVYSHDICNGGLPIIAATAKARVDAVL